MYTHLEFRSRSIPFWLVRVLAGIPAVFALLYATSVAIGHQWTRVDRADGLCLGLIAVGLMISAALALRYKKAAPAIAAFVVASQVMIFLMPALGVLLRRGVYGQAIQIDLPRMLLSGAAPRVVAAAVLAATLCGPVLSGAMAFHRRAGYDATGAYLFRFGISQVIFTLLALCLPPPGRPMPLSRLLDDGWGRWDPNTSFVALMIALAVAFSFAGLTVTAWLSVHQARWLRRVLAGRDRVYQVRRREVLCVGALPAKVVDPSHDGVIVAREMGGSGPFRAALVEQPIATCYRDARRTTGPLWRRAALAAALLMLQVSATVGTLVWAYVYR